MDVSLSNGESVRAQYLVGCDGGRSLVRKQAGIEFLDGKQPGVRLKKTARAGALG